MSVFILATLIRLLALAIITLFFGGVLAGDDVTYTNLAQQMASGETSGWDERATKIYRETAALTVPLTAIYYLFGPIPLLGKLFVLLFGSASAALTTRLVLEEMRVRWALLAGLIMAALPSQVVWSLTILKDPLVWTVLIGMALCVSLGAKATGVRLAVIGLILTTLAVVMGFLRFHTLVVAVWALVVAAVFLGSGRLRMQRLAASCLIALIVPAAFGLGIGGFGLVTRAGSLEERRLANARDADSAFIEVDKPKPTEASPTSDKTAEGSSPNADADFRPSGFVLDLLRLPRGLSVMLLEPYPWSTYSDSSYFVLAKVGSVVWYPVLFAAVVGLFSGSLRRRRLTVFPVVCATPLLFLYAFTEGNLGTAYRHRGEFVWVVAILASSGVMRLVERRSSPGCA